MDPSSFPQNKKLPPENQQIQFTNKFFRSFKQLHPFELSHPCGSTSFVPLVTSSVLTVKVKFTSRLTCVGGRDL